MPSDQSRKINEQRSFAGALMYLDQGNGTSEPASRAYPMPVQIVSADGSGPGGQAYTPQILDVGAGQALTVPDGATHALVRVVTGSARMGLMDASVAPEVGPGGGMDDLSGALLTALRVDVLSGQVRIDYWKVG